MLGLAVSLSFGCATERPFVWVNDVSAVPAEPNGAIHPRDVIVVAVRDQPTVSTEATVHDDGTYLQPMVGNLHVAGQTVEHLQAQLRDVLKTLVVNPTVTVSLVRTGPIRVAVVGEVKAPGSYELSRDRGVVAALAAAGWLTDFATKDRIFVVRSRESGPRIRFRAAELTSAEPRSALFRLRDEDVVVVE